jgi:hypothetical protein
MLSHRQRIDAIQTATEAAGPKPQFLQQSGNSNSYTREGNRPLKAASFDDSPGHLISNAIP